MVDALAHLFERLASVADTPSRLEIELLRALLRCGYARPWHLVAWTGAGTWTINERLREMAKRSLVRSRVVVADLRGSEGTSTTYCTVWEGTGRGAKVAGTWAVAGSSTQITLPARPPTSGVTDVTLGMADLAVWYRRFGFDIATPRELRSTERGTPLHQATVRDVWATTLMRGDNLLRPPRHLPTVGAVHPSEAMWTVELELGVRATETYRTLVDAARWEGLGQTWHVASKRAFKRLMKAGAASGVTWERHPSIRGVVVSHDVMTRIQAWAPGRAGLSTPSQWRGLLPRTPPAGIPVPHPLPDLRATWKRGLPPRGDVKAKGLDPH